MNKMCMYVGMCMYAYVYICNVYTHESMYIYIYILYARPPPPDLPSVGLGVERVHSAEVSRCTVVLHDM